MRQIANYLSHFFTDLKLSSHHGHDLINYQLMSALTERNYNSESCSIPLSKCCGLATSSKFWIHENGIASL